VGTSQRVTVITPTSTGGSYWRACFEYRELLWFLGRRDLVVRYRQTLAGILWLLVRPAGQVLAFTLVFGHLAGFEAEGGLPYPILAASGVIAWSFFAAIVSQSTIALTNNRNLITKVHFPRILLPIGTVVPNLIDVAIGMVVLLICMLAFGYLPSWRILFLPVPIAMLAVIALGMGFWFSAGSVRYRDVRQLSPFLMNLLYMFSPVGFPTSVVRERLSETWVAVYYCNPLATAIDLFRWCVHPAGFAPGQHLSLILPSCVAGLVVIVSGQWFFRRLERTFADVI
jgi:lipopolysaccharide transport system permease protein